jgi:hypothetical protein
MKCGDGQCIGRENAENCYADCAVSSGVNSTGTFVVNTGDTLIASIIDKLNPFKIIQRTISLFR